MTAPDQFAFYDAAYVLGALSPSDRHAYEQHLRECPSCDRGVRELAGMPGLLGRTSADDVQALVEAEPPPTLLPALVARVRRHRRRGRWLLAAATTAAAACLAAVIGLAVVPGGGSGTQPPLGTAMTQLTPGPIHVRARLIDVPWGTRIDLRCRYDTGAYAAGSYKLMVTDRTGDRQQVATWSAVEGRTSTVDASTAWHRDDIKSVAVLTAAGEPVLQLTP